MAMLTLGGYLKQKEHLSARLGDVLSALYMASMVLKHYENQGRPEADLPLVEWSCRTLLYEAQEQLHGFLRNFPNRWVAALMRLRDLPARPHLLRGERPARPQDRRAADGAVRDARAPVARHLQDRRAGQPDRPAAGGAGALGRRRAAREAAAGRGREDRPHHRARPARPDRAGAGRRVAEPGRGAAAARLRPQGDGHHQRGRLRHRGPRGRRGRCTSGRCADRPNAGGATAPRRPPVRAAFATLAAVQPPTGKQQRPLRGEPRGRRGDRRRRSTRGCATTSPTCCSSTDSARRKSSTTTQPPPGRIRRIVQYRLRDRAALDDYLAMHAPRMRAQGIGRFGDRATEESRVLPHREEFVRGAVSTENCLNCGEVLTGQHCSHCGQHARVRVLSLWGLVQGRDRRPAQCRLAGLAHARAARVPARACSPRSSCAAAARATRRRSACTWC